MPETKVITSYIGIGSNLGDRLRNCREAVESIRGVPGCRVTGRSGWYLTRPVGVAGQEWYINGALSLATVLSARDLLDRLLDIEKRMGRVRTERWGPRTIDLDILLYGEEIIQEDLLTIPHPLMHVRRFVLVPMAQLAPNMIHPLLGMRMSELLEKLRGDELDVIAVKE